MKPKITIVTVTYNCVSILEETIRSVAGQDYPDKEYIVIDGASTDGTVDLIKKNERAITRWQSQPDAGIFDAMNKGLALATGEWIIFMNAGDLFYAPHTLSSIPFGDYPPQTGFIHGYFQMRHNGVIDKRVPFYKNPGFYKPMGFSHQSALVRTSLAQEIKFDLSYRLASDYHMIREIYRRGYLPADTRQCLSVMVVDEGCTAGNRKKQYIETARICGCYGTFRFALLLRYRLCKQTLKKLLRS